VGPEETVEQEELVAIVAATVALVVVWAVEEVLAAEVTAGVAVEVLVALRPGAGDRMLLLQTPEARCPLRPYSSMTPFVGRVLHQLSSSSVAIAKMSFCPAGTRYSQSACSLRWNRPALSPPSLSPIRAPVKKRLAHAEGVTVSGQSLDSVA